MARVEWPQHNGRKYMKIIIMLEDGVNSITSETYPPIDFVKEKNTFPTNEIDFNEKINDLIEKMQIKSNTL